MRAVTDAGGKETGMVEVPTGGRRYRALELLVKQKRLPKCNDAFNDKIGYVLRASINFAL